MILRTRKLGGLISAFLTSLIWGSSFIFIKLSVTDVSAASYTAVRSLISLGILLPFLLHRYVVGLFDKTSFSHGLIIGVSYALGLYLQADGTRYVSPSTSAFITGLNTLHVHLYYATIKKSYNLFDALSLSLAVSGLYMLTGPTGELNTGALMVFLGSIAWGAQIILVSKYSRGSMLETLAGMFLVGTLIFPLVIVAGGDELNSEVLIYLSYLAIFCSVAASFFQVLAQRYISAKSAATIYLLEPVFALLFSLIAGIEGLNPHKLIGGGLILVATYLVVLQESKGWNQ